MPHRFTSLRVRCVLTCLTIWLAAGGLVAAEPAGARRLPALPAEFERQDAILLSWNADDEGVEEALTAIVAAVYRNLHVIVLTPDDEYLRSAMRCFSLAGIPRTAVRYVGARVDTIWTRDYGPASIRVPDGTMAFVNADYETGTRSQDDRLPAAIAPLLGLPSVHVPLAVDGGNLLSNGHGLCLATTRLRDANLARGYTEEQIRELLREAYGFTEVVFLDPLRGEPTGHVDMFATFVAPHVVVVGAYDPAIDPVNAEVLERNARRLAAVRTPWGPLRVVRIPMPPSGPQVWRTYTNVLYANGTLVVPSYPGITPEYEHEAFQIYRQLLPEWRIVPVDCNRLIALGGGIHCVTMNLCRVARLPRAVELGDVPEDAVPGQEALPRPLGVGNDGWRPVARADERLPEIDRVFVPAVEPFELEDECSTCCPTTGEPLAVPPRRPRMPSMVRDGGPYDRRTGDWGGPGGWRPTQHGWTSPLPSEITDDDGPWLAPSEPAR